jgi:hypothetical protein
VTDPGIPDPRAEEALRALLTAAVEPIRPDGTALPAIRQGVYRRRRWRVSTFAAGAVALAGALVAVTLVLVNPSSPTTAEVAQNTVGVTARVIPSGTPGPSSRIGTPATGGTVVPTGPASWTPSGTGTVSTPSPTASRGDAPVALPSPTQTPAMPGDVDGDGKLDPVTAQGTLLTVELSRTHSTWRLTLPGTALGPVYAYDLDGDGFSELIVATGTSGGTTSYVVFRYIGGGELTELPDPSAQAKFTTGSTSLSGSGFSCGDNGITVVSGSSSDGGQTYTVVTTVFQPTLTDWRTVGGPTPGTLSGSAAPSTFTARCGNPVA